MKPIICVTEKEFNKAQNIFHRASDICCKPCAWKEEILARTIKENKAFGAVIGVETYTDLLYACLPAGGIIARFGVGHDGVDKAQATQAGIIVTNTPGVLDDSVAELAIWLIGSLARGIPKHNALMISKRWTPEIGIEVKGKTLLIVGCGAIGSRTGRIAGWGLGMKVIGFDTAPLDALKLRTDYGVCLYNGNLDEALAQADFVSIHIPLTSETHHYVDQSFLEKMKPGSFLVNTARGAVIDEMAVFDAVKGGHIAGAALDTYETEPYIPVDKDHDLRMLPGVILTPHIGSSTEEACDRMAERCLYNVRSAYRRAYDELDILNREVLSRL